MRRHGLNSPRLAGLRKARRWGVLNKFLIILTGLAVVFGGLSYFSRLDRLQIKEIKVVGNKVVDENLIKETVGDNLNGNYLWLLPRRNFFIYPKTDILNNLSSKWMRLKDITLNVTNNRVLEISVGERQGVYMWCKSTDSCYFADSQGYIFDEAPYFSGVIYFKFYGGVTEPEYPLGKYIGKEYFSKLIVFKDALDRMGLKPVSMGLESDGEVKAYLPPAKGSTREPEIMFKSNEDLEKLALNLETALDTDPLKTDFRKKYPSLIYIDLRFGNKVYYKFQ